MIVHGSRKSDNHDDVEHGLIRTARAFTLAPQIIAHGVFLPWKATRVEGWVVSNWNPFERDNGGDSNGSE